MPGSSLLLVMNGVGGEKKELSSSPPVSLSSTPNRGSRPLRQARSKGLQSLAEPMIFDAIYAEDDKNSRKIHSGRGAKGVKGSNGAPFGDATSSDSKMYVNLTNNSSDKDINEFTEPEVATPQPIYTGLPLEAFPTAKIKKDSLWSVKKSKKPKQPINTSTTSNNDSEIEIVEILPSPPADEELSKDLAEDKYKKQLQLAKSKSEKLTTASSIRLEKGAKNVAKNNSIGKFLRKKRAERADASANADKKQITYSKLLHGKSAGGDEPRVKRIKVISPKKPASTNLSTVSSMAPPSFSLPVLAAPASSSAMSTKNNSSRNTPIILSEDDNSKDNDDYCFTCGGPGIFICCETCPKSFHFTCCNPPLEECPEDTWNCLECRWKESNGSKKGKTKVEKSASLFGQLLSQLESRNPKEYLLPEGIRNETFIGIGTGVNGHYEDDNDKPELTQRQKQQLSNQIQGFNFDPDLEIDSLYDKIGRPHLCHRCAESGLNGRTLTHCDYCSLCWHLDCLDPPLVTPKTIGSKWKCPNHIDDLLMMGLKSKCRQFLNTQVLDVSLQNHFLKIANANNFIIKQSDQPLIKDDKEVSLDAYMQYEQEVFKPKENNESTASSWEISGDSAALPDYFKVQNTSSGVSSAPNPRLKKS